MTISQNSQYVLEHPFTKRAVRLGIAKDLKLIFDLLQIDTYQEVAALCCRAFRAKRGQNNPIVEAAIREVEPPTRLNIHLPIPPPECIVVVMHKGRRRVYDPMQLEIDFTVKKGDTLQIAL